MQVSRCVLRLEIPESILQACPRHFMSANVAKPSGHIGGRLECFAEYGWSEHFADYNGRRAHRFRVEDGRLHGSDFRPARKAAYSHFDEEQCAIEGCAETGFERRLQPHLQLP